MKERPCIVCGTMFTHARGQTKICSKECKKIRDKQLRHEYTDKLDVVKCAWCGKEFMQNSWNHNSCSKVCKAGMKMMWSGSNG